MRQIEAARHITHGDHGEPYVVIEWVTMIPVTAGIDGKSIEVRGPRHFTLADGVTEVDEIDSQTFKKVGGVEMSLSRVVPKAGAAVINAVPHLSNLVGISLCVLC